MTEDLNWAEAAAGRRDICLLSVRTVHVGTRPA